MDRWVGKVAIVTGASSGIGASIAEKLTQAGLKVVGFARRSERVEEIAKKLSSCKGKLYACKVDMTVESDIEKGFEWTTKNVGPVHILVNNAGIVKQTSLMTGEPQAWKQVLDTNVLGLAIASKLAIKIMNENKIDGHIVHINSITGHKIVHSPNSGMYSASKWAVTAYHECLRQELNLAKSKIKVTSVSPGFVQTEIADNFDEASKEFMKVIPFLKSEDIADGIMYALATPPNVVIYELTIKPLGETM